MTSPSLSCPFDPSVACRVIGEALQRNGKSGAHPSDYLNFYAIANRQKNADSDLKQKHNKGAEKAGAKPDKSFIHVHATCVHVSPQQSRWLAWH